MTASEQDAEFVKALSQIERSFEEALIGLAALKDKQGRFLSTSPASFAALSAIQTLIRDAEEAWNAS